MNPSDYNFTEILAVHERNMKQSTLPYVFGDGFLNVNSKIFRNVRERALEAGVVFAAANEGWLLQYTYYPLAFLGRIYELRTVPCVESYKAMLYIREELRQKTLPNRPNQTSVFHETCHILANDFFGGGAPDFSKAASRDEKLRLAAKVLAVEAFANTAEFLLANENSEAEFKVFSRYNIFMNYSTNSYCSLKFLFEKFGTYGVFRFLFYSMYYSNYQYSQYTESVETCDLLIKNSGISANGHVRALFYSLLKSCFMLNRAFTNLTAKEYFVNLNGPENLEEVYEFNLEQVLFAERRFEEFLVQAHDLLLRGKK